jgi:hypothetical protein
VQGGRNRLGPWLIRSDSSYLYFNCFNLRAVPRCYAQSMPDRSSKRPRDPNELAKQLVDEATGESPKFDPDAGKDPNAVALGRKGGLKGGKARAASLTPEQRSELARRAAQSRWNKPQP